MKINSQLTYIIEAGKTRYILVHGVLGWGLVGGLLTSAWIFYTQNYITINGSVKPFIMWTISGILWESVIWSGLKKQFEKERLRTAEKSNKQ